VPPFDITNYAKRSIIKKLSTNKCIYKRRICRKELISSIGKKQILFDKWYTEVKGKNEYLKSLRGKLFSTLNSQSFDRFFVIDIGEEDNVIPSIKELVLLISHKWSRLSKREPNPFSPYIYLRNLSPEKLKTIRDELYKESNLFEDGYYYQNAPFDYTRMLNTNRDVKFRFINSDQDLCTAIDHSSKTKELYQFVKGVPYDFGIDNIKTIAIQVEEINDIKEII